MEFDPKEQPPAPAVIRVDVNHNMLYDTFHHACPETHFQCNNNGYCLPVYMRCNEVNDCPQHEDEVDCELLQCQGLYRCYDSRTCLYDHHLCDGMVQCPHDDDELFCQTRNYRCPDNCSCDGFSFFCKGVKHSLDIDYSGYYYHYYFGKFNGDNSLLDELRYLHVSDSWARVVEHVTNTMHYLVHLGLSNCGLRLFPDVSLPSLHSLDLSDNHLQELSWLQPARYKHLRELSLSGNPLSQQVLASLEQVHPRLLSLDMSNIQMQGFKLTHYKFAPNLKTLNLSHCSIQVIKSDNTTALTNLLYLDFSGSDVSNFPSDIFYQMSNLVYVRTDNPKLCCPAMYQTMSKTLECVTPTSVPGVGSCDSLLQTDGYRLILYLFALLALVGNSFSFLIRLFVEKATVIHGFAVFVTHLTVSDFLMGVYLAIIGVADQIYHEDYFRQDKVWTRSVACKTAGFLCLLSSEVSAFLIALITLDRYLVFRFPFRHVRFSVTSARATVAVVWTIGLAFSAVPLLPMTSHWTVYSNTATCFALPFVKDFHGRDYVFGVVIIVNFVLFFFVALGQSSIYLTIRDNSMPIQSQSRDIHIARRLVAIALSDFLCWFPVGLLGVSASIGTRIPRELNMLVAVSVMPLNSALNPFWYTLNLVLEKYRIRQEKRILQTMLEINIK